jgi:hypothetical protein
VLTPSGSPPKYSDVVADDSASTKSSGKSSSGFRSGALKRSNASGIESLGSREDDEDGVLSLGLPGHRPHVDRDGDWGIGDDARMGLE